MFLFVELVIWSLICIVLVSYEKGLAAFVATGIAAGVAAFAGFNVFTWVWANPLLFGQFFLVYVAVGIGWSSMKWYIKLRKARVSYVKAKAEYLEDNVNATEQNFIDNVKNNYMKERFAPTVSRNKGNLGFWCIWWPFSMITFLLEDFIREMWNLAWKFLKNLFEVMRKRTLGEAARDLD